MGLSSLFSSRQIEDILSSVTIGTADLSVSRVSIDSRDAGKDSLFIPLVGKVVDGNLYIESALKLGCRLSLVSTEFYKENGEAIANLASRYNAMLFIVDSGLDALHTLAKWYIGQFENLRVVGITGSSGKTSTKEILGSILGQAGKALVTKGNYNSETGLPLTVFRITEEHRFAVLEMGMSSPGEIKALVNISNPDIGIITNIGMAHIGFFNDQQGIATEKKDIFSLFSGNNVAIIPNWDSYSSFLERDVNGRVVLVSNSPAYITDIESKGLSGWSFLYQGSRVLFPYIGEYNLKNAYLAIACARELNIPSSNIVTGLNNVASLFGRVEVLIGKNRVVRDCYNANPESMRSALVMLANMEWDGGKLPILGSMFELGSNSLTEHTAIVKFAMKFFPMVIFFGKEFEIACSNLEVENGYKLFTDMDTMKKALYYDVGPGVLVLLKASRGVKLEDITETIL